MPEDQETARRRDESIHRAVPAGRSESDRRGSKKTGGQSGVVQTPDETNFDKLLEDMRKNGLYVPPPEEIKK